MFKLKSKVRNEGFLGTKNALCFLWPRALITYSDTFFKESCSFLFHNNLVNQKRIVLLSSKPSKATASILEHVSTAETTDLSKGSNTQVFSQNELPYLDWWLLHLGCLLLYLSPIPQLQVCRCVTVAVPSRLLISDVSYSIGLCQCHIVFSCSSSPACPSKHVWLFVSCAIARIQNTKKVKATLKLSFQKERKERTHPHNVTYKALFCLPTHNNKNN